MRLRKLLWLTLVTNLITNLLLATMLVGVLVFWLRMSGDVSEPLPEGAGRAPSSSQPVLARKSAPPARKAAAPARKKPGTGPQVSAADADSKAIHERLGIEPHVWDRLTRGEVVFTRTGDDTAISFRAYFLVRATPEKLFGLFTNYANMPSLYEEVKKTVVLERTDQFAVVYYRSRYLFFNLSWVVKEEFSEDRCKISWNLVAHPKYPSKLKRATGHWKFVPTGVGQMTLLSYQNDFKLSMLPKSLAQRFAKQNIPKMAANIRDMVARLR